MLSRTTFKVQFSSKFNPEKFNLHPNQFKVQFNSTQLNSFQVQFKPNLGQFSDFSQTGFCVLVFVLRPPNEWEESCTLTGAQLFRHFHHFHLFFSTASAAPVGCFLPFCTSIAQFVSFLVGGANWRLGQSDHMFFSSIFSAPPRHTDLTPGPGGRRPGGHSGLCR